MRVTNNMMINSLLYSLQNNFSRMSDSQNRINTTKRVNKASDDPIDAAKILKYRTDLAEFEQYQKNVRDTTGGLEVAETTVAEVGKVLQRARELTVSAANGGKTPDDLKKINAEIKNLIEQLVTSGNFNFAGKYLFSGYQTDKPLFKKDGTYNVDITDKDFSTSPKLELLVGAGEKMHTSVSGLDIFGIVNAVNAFTTLFTDTAGDTMTLNKSAVKGRFDLKTAYSADTLDVTIGGIVFDVNEVGLDGTAEQPLQPDIVIERYLSAQDGTGTQTLRDVANVYFDDNKNLVIEAKTPGNVAINTASSNYMTSAIYTGDNATKSTLKAPFALDGPTADYTTQNLDVTTSLGTFDVDESTLNGYAFNITREMVLDKFRNALYNAGGPNETKLSEVADIYFDQEDNLVIKERSYGAQPLAMAGAPIAGYPAVYEAGKATAEATLDFGQFTFDDSFISLNQEELKNTPLYFTYNGQRKAVYLDTSTNITTAAQYQTAMQTAIDKTFGVGKIATNLAGAAPNHYFTFSTTGTPDGQKPELRLEVIKSKQSSLMEDIKAFSNALDKADMAGIQDFLSKVDGHLNRVIAVRADIGARVSRMTLIKNRLEENTLSFTGMLSEAQDTDIAKEIMFLKNAENIYRASLSTGGRVIQPTLMDFLR